MQSDSPRVLQINEMKQQFSYAYLKAIASAASLNLSKPDSDVESVDARIHGKHGVTIEAQLKCTSVCDIRDDGIHFQLKEKNYLDLTDQNTMFPRILIVLVVPEEPNDWVKVTCNEVTIKKCAWWKQIQRREERDQVNNPTIILPIDNILTPDKLIELMSKASTGTLL